jgi:hypothetical protein
MKRLAFALVLIATPALADGDAWTDGGGITHYQNYDGSGGMAYQDGAGQMQVQTYDGRTGTVWQDGGGITHYQGDAFNR